VSRLIVVVQGRGVKEARHTWQEKNNGVKINVFGAPEDDEPSADLSANHGRTPMENKNRGQKL